MHGSVSGGMPSDMLACVMLSLLDYHMHLACLLHVCHMIAACMHTSPCITHQQSIIRE